VGPRPGGARQCGAENDLEGKRLMLEVAVTYEYLAKKAEKDVAK
jgi:hypothetical protein